MRALILQKHGEFDQFSLINDHPLPSFSKKSSQQNYQFEDVLIKVKATSLNYHDLYTMRGELGFNLSLPLICGLDIAGEVIEVADKVEGIQRGDRVLIDPHNRRDDTLMGETVNGGLAQYCVVKASQVIKIPNNVSYDQAACLPAAYATAHRMIKTQGNVQRGERVLILGASGGVGTSSLILCKSLGAEVIIAAGSDDKIESLKAIGADVGFNYKEAPIHKQIWDLYGKPQRLKMRGGVDVVINFTGGDCWNESIKSLRRGGKLLNCGATAGYNVHTDLRYLYTYELKLIGSNGWERTDIESLLHYVEEGKFSPIVDRRIGLEGVIKGLKAIDQRKVFGKIVVNP